MKPDWTLIGWAKVDTNETVMDLTMAGPAQRGAFGFNAPTPSTPFGSTNFFGVTFANNPPSTSPNFGWTDTFTLTDSMGNSYGGGAVSGPGGVGLGGVFGGSPIGY